MLKLILIYLLIGCLCDILAFIGLLAAKEEWLNEISFKEKLKLHFVAILLWPAPIYEIIHKDKEELNDAFDEVYKGEESKK